MLFPTHDNIEHLAMIETVIQQEFPRSMTMRAGKNARKLIRNDGRIDWPEGASGQQSLRLVEDFFVKIVPKTSKSHFFL